MGNRFSGIIDTEIDNLNKTCLICWDNVSNIDSIRCNNCPIILHANCEEEYRNTAKYCKCPHCQQIGTLYN
jgi:hypothetical protein